MRASDTWYGSSDIRFRARMKALLSSSIRPTTRPLTAIKPTWRYCIVHILCCSEILKSGSRLAFRCIAVCRVLGKQFPIPVSLGLNGLNSLPLLVCCFLRCPSKPHHTSGL